MATVTKKDIIDRLQVRLANRGTPPSKQTLNDVVDAWVDELMNALVQGSRIEFRGFGVFSPKARKARRGRNPKTGAPVEVPARTTVVFQPGKDFKVKLQPVADAPKA